MFHKFSFFNPTQRLPLFVDYLDAKLINSDIFTAVCSGFSDTVPAVRWGGGGLMFELQLRGEGLKDGFRLCALQVYCCVRFWDTEIYEKTVVSQMIAMLYDNFQIILILVYINED